MTRFENNELIVYFESYAIKGGELVMPARRFLEIAHECWTEERFRARFHMECERRAPKTVLARAAGAGQ